MSRRSAMPNFAASLVDRLSDGSRLVDAPTGEVVDAPEMREAIAGFAAGFRSAGLSAGDRVLIACEVTPASSLAYLGAIYGGYVPVPVPESAFPGNAEAILRKSCARALWSGRRIEAGWAGRGVVQLEGRLDRQHPYREPSAARASDELAALMPTSGSTGPPKLVRVTHGNLIANTEAIIRSQYLGSDERAMLILPVSYCFGASVLHTHLYGGGAVVFDSRFMFPDKVLRAMAEYRCTTFAGVPTVYNILLRRSNIRRIPLPSVHRFLQAGGALEVQRVDEMGGIAPHAEFFVMYGQTEATSRITCLPPSRLAVKRGSVGVPLEGLQIRIMSGDGHDVPAGETGEVWVSGASVCDGYFDDPEATADRFRDGWLLTGDIGSRDEDGYLWLAGRKSEFVKMRGIRLSYAEVETTVTAAQGVRECAALAVPHPEAGEALALYVVADAAVETVWTEIRRSTPAEWIIDSIHVVKELPKNASGKLVRSRLRELARQ